MNLYGFWHIPVLDARVESVSNARVKVGGGELRDEAVNYVCESNDEICQESATLWG